MTLSLWKQTASELAEQIRAKKVTSRAVIEAHLERIEAVNDHVNAVTVVLTESALAAADAADASEATGPLHGVPFTVKENLDCVGSATTQGVPAMAEMMPPSDAVVVERMKRAGGIPIGRTNLPEMGMRLDTDNPLRGRTHNPWDPGRTPGGSSGGEAAALATGMSRCWSKDRWRAPWPICAWVFRFSRDATCGTHVPWTLPSPARHLR